MFGKVKRLYFVGIGGAGMSGIAEILFNLGYQIKGSDHTPSEVTEYLESLGIAVHTSHQAANLADVDVVVISSAVGESNPEVVEARRQGIPVIKRAEMLGELMRLKFSVGVSGTHGKTTTTSMIGRIMLTGNYQPTIIVGGVVTEMGTGAALGEGDHLICEADEYDRSFLSMFPTMAVVTNVEPDHLDCYNGMEDLLNAYLTYMNRVPFYGEVIISADDDNLNRLKHKLTRPYVTFGFSPDAEFRALNVNLEPGRSTFAVYNRGDLLGEVILHVPGKHNVANALAAIAACTELEVPFETIVDGLLHFTGVSRRFELIGEANDIMVIDDYAHHPTEVKATLDVAREVYNRRVVVLYQPHLFSRTRDFMDDFIDVLSTADVPLLVDIYPAREEPIPGITSEELVRKAHARGFRKFVYAGPRQQCVAEAMKHITKGDLVITMGAGSITLHKQELLEAIKTL